MGGDEKAERHILHLRTACPQKTGKKEGLLGLESLGKTKY